MRKCIIVITGLLFFLSSMAQKLEEWEIVSPLDFETTLSGSFAEMRRNHFHGGIDLRTNGEENKPVYSIDNGYVSKITISRTSYGKCAFIVHPNGYTSVYGHLNGFVPKLDSILKAKQYQEQRFEVTLELDSTQYPVKKGELFAKSGNTGASGGPHVHFELRKTSDHTMRNPFLVKNQPYGVVDNKAPKIFGIKLYGIQHKGLINGSEEKLCKVVVNKDCSRRLQVGSGLTAWGNIGFAVRANDYMTGVGFSYSPRYLRVYADDKLISDIKIDSFLFQNIRASNSFVDYSHWAKTREFYMKSFKDHNSPLCFQKAQPYGVLTIDEERDYHIIYEVEDDFGNTDRIQFVITGKRTDLPIFTKDESEYIKCGETVFFDKGSFGMRFEKNSLYEDFEHQFKCDSSARFYSNIYTIGNELTPLHTFCDISIKIENDTIADKSKYYVAKLNANNVPSGSAGGTYINGVIAGKTNTLGRFAVNIDVTSPVIAPVHTNKLRNLPYIRFKIYDTQSGIDTYDAYIDDKWVMFEYDAKTQQITYWLDKKQVEEFKYHTLRMVIKDYCGNTKEFTKQIYW